MRRRPPAGARVNWAHPLSRDLYALFLFNEGAGRRANDLGPRVFVPTVGGNAVLQGDGLGGVAAVTDYMAIPAVNAWNNFTLLAIYTARVLGAGSPVMGVMDPPVTGANGADNTIYQTATNLWQYNVFLGGNKFLTGTESVLMGVPTHLAGGVGRGFMEFYVNGKSVGRTALASADNRYPNPKLVFLGGYAGAFLPGTGVLHYAAIYSTLLTAEEVTRHMQDPYGNLV